MSKQKPMSSEEGEGDSTVKPKGREMVREVRFKEGEDGVPETHISYTDRRRKSFSYGGQGDRT